MPSPPRDVSPGYHHVWVNATGSWDYFLDEVDRIAWVRFIVRTFDRFGWGCIAFCQMSTHVHLLLRIDDRSLSLGMRELNREYSCAFNVRHDRVGTFVRGRFGSRLTEGADDLLGSYRYVVRNPVAGGLCQNADEWHWSSYRTTLGLCDDFPFVDAGIVVAEVGGLRRLRALVDSPAPTRRK